VLLAAAMTALLDRFPPSWLAGPGYGADPLAGSQLAFTLYHSSWDAGRVLATAKHQQDEWAATFQLSELESALSDASDGILSDITIGGESVPTTLDGDELQIPIGPFLVTGTVSDWRQVIDREGADSLPLSQAPTVPASPWHSERISFPVTSID
jgi:hypothetical protein